MTIIVEVNMKKVTQNDIAKALGFSRRTVARALNGDDNISETKRALIVEYCEKVGYKKNTLSSILAPGNIKKIHVFLIESINEDYLKETKKGILLGKEQLSDYKVEFIIHSTSIDDPSSQVELLERILKTDTVSGLIIIPIDTAKINDILQKYNVSKVITIDKRISTQFSHIGKDYLQSGMISADMIRREDPNFDNTLIVNTNSDEIASDLYYQGFKDYLLANQIEHESEVYIEHLNINCHQISNYSLDNIKYIFAPRYSDILIQYLLNQNISHIKFVVTGINENIIDYLDKNIVISAINQSYFLHGYLASKSIFKLIMNPSELITFISKNEIITKENMNNLNNDVRLASLFDLF